jgi:hypothetical protein
MKNLLYLILLVANGLVLLGQLWPEGAPPFAHSVNIATLVANMLVFLTFVMRRRGKPKG